MFKKYLSFCLATVIFVQLFSTVGFAASNSDAQFNIIGEAYKPVVINPSVRDYEIEEGLANIENINQFSNLTQQQIDMIVKNGFVVSPTEQLQLFYVYEDNAYKKVPTFITTDSVLQVYHIYYDYALRSLEADTFYSNAATLNNNLLAELINVYNAIENIQIKEQALITVGYFGVAQLLFGKELPENFPSEIKDTVLAEIELIDNSTGREFSPLMNYKIDYSLFVPRGHYTRSEALTKYFYGMTWYGIVSFPFYGDEDSRDTNNALRSVILSSAIKGMPAETGIELWMGIYNATSFFVGNADDVTPYQLFDIVESVYGKSPDMNELLSGMDKFYENVDMLPKPQIISKNKDDKTGLQMRFMGQRYIPDSEILQELCESFLRPFPSGLDVLAVLGSERAKYIIDNEEKPNLTWPEYDKNFEIMKNKFGSLDEATWQSNLYYAWLNTLKSLLGNYGKGYPRFMQSTAWEDKSISTALGSWAELRHDTILYGKQSAAECGGGAEAPVVYGYVEPNVEVYNKLLWMTKFSRENLSAAGLLNRSVENKMRDFEDMLSFLLDCSIRELEGKSLTAQDYDQFLTYGGWLEYMTSSLADENINKWYQIESETDKNMAVIADVHTAGGTYLEAAVGTAAEIYVVFPVEDKLYLGRGAVFDYFEFKSNKRLTDEEWQKSLQANPPERPSWTGNYMEEGEGGVPVPVEPYSSGC